MGSPSDFMHSWSAVLWPPAPKLCDAPAAPASGSLNAMTVPGAAVMKFHSSSQPVIPALLCSREQRQSNTHSWITSSMGHRCKVMTFLTVTWLVSYRDVWQDLIKSQWWGKENQKKRRIWMESVLSVVMLPAYHHTQLANDTVGLDDPVDRLDALEQQDNLFVQGAVVLQRLQIHYDIHLESTAEIKKRGERERKKERKRRKRRILDGWVHIVLSCLLCLAN